MVCSSPIPWKIYTHIGDISAHAAKRNQNPVTPGASITGIKEQMYIVHMHVQKLHQTQTHVLSANKDGFLKSVSKSCMNTPRWKCVYHTYIFAPSLTTHAHAVLTHVYL